MITAKYSAPALTKTQTYFVTDVHGSDRCFKKFLNAGKFYKASVLILGGDVTGKMIVPIVKQSDGILEIPRLWREHGDEIKGAGG